MSDTQENLHARLSFSKLPRIIECPGSVPATEAMEREVGPEPERRSPSADRGTYLHSVQEDYLLRDVYKVDTVLDEDKKTNAEFVEAIETLLAYVYSLRASDPANFIVEHVEQRVSLKAYANEYNNDLLEECEGTCDYDCSIGRTLHVIDWKFGNILVDPDSPQIIGYAAGCLRNPEYARKHYDKVVCTVGQPFSGNEAIKTAVFTVDEILRWVKHELSPALLRTKADPWILCPSEHACRFCRAKARCSARKNMAVKIAQDVFKMHAELPNIVSIEELAALADQFEFLDAYIRDLATYMFSEITSGREVPGYKVVRGKANRKWENEKQAIITLEQMGYELEDLSDVKFYGPAAVEKLISKDHRKSEEFLKLIIKPQGGLTLTKLSDKRPAETFLTAEDVFSDFVEEE